MGSLWGVDSIWIILRRIYLSMSSKYHSKPNDTHHLPMITQLWNNNYYRMVKKKSWHFSCVISGFPCLHFFRAVPNLIWNKEATLENPINSPRATSKDDPREKQKQHPSTQGQGGGWQSTEKIYNRDLAAKCWGKFFIWLC